MGKREQLLEIMEDAAKGETKATLRARIAELEAEVERLRNMLNGYGKLDAELAIAERRARAVCDNAKLVDIDKNGAFNYVVPPYLIDALKAAMET